MLRWHEKACSKPEVDVLGGLPCCRNCFAVASINDIEVMKSRPLPYTPPVDHFGSFNLHWPSIVKFTHGNESLDNASNDTSKPPRGHRQPESERADMSERPSEGTWADQARDSETLNDDRTWDQRGLTFAYPSLIHRNEIRVLDLDSGSQNDLLHADFSVVQAGARDTDYEALSYTWADEYGNSDRCRPMFIGAFWDTIPITRNCEQALRNIRFAEGRKRKLWIDAICINQDDDDDRATQVALMAQIYSSAAGVIMYVGPMDDTSDMALRVIAKANFGLKCGHASTEDICNNCLAFAQKMFRRPYFRRLWVVQEVVLGGQLILHCGPQSMVWEPALTTKLPFAQWVMHRCQDESWNTEDLASNLISLVTDTSDCVCSDPRDKIFALLGLIHGLDNTTFSADYTLTVPEVYIGVAAYLAQNSRGKEVFLLASMNRPRISGLPSWVPDITKHDSDDEWLKLIYRRLRAWDSSGRSGWRQHDSRPMKCLSFYPSGTSPVRIDSTTGAIHVSAVRICNVVEFFRCKNYTEWIERECPDGLTSQISLALPIFTSDVGCRTQVCEGDTLYWVPGIESYAILQPDGESNIHSLVSACEFMLKYEFDLDEESTWTPQLKSIAESCLFQEWDSVAKRLRKNVGDNDITSMPRAATLNRLLDIAFHLNGHPEAIVWEQKLWQDWTDMRRQYGDLLRSYTGRRLIANSWKRTTMAKQLFSFGEEGTPAFLILWKETIPILLWSLLGSRNEGQSEGKTPPAGDSNPDQETALLKGFKKWARTTVALMLLLGEHSKSQGQSLAQMIPGGNLLDMWNKRWLLFTKHALPQRKLDLGEEEWAELTESLVRLHSQGAHASKDNTSDRATLELTHDKELLWDWDETQHQLQARWKIWKSLEDDPWISKWRSSRPQDLTGLEQQLAVRLRTMPLYFDFDIYTEISIC